MESKHLPAFFDFIYQRQLIYWRKEVLKLPPPWSDNEIFQKYSFCNIFRFNDKGTKYLWNSVLNPQITLSDETKLFNTFVYRIFNRMNLFDGDIWTEPLSPFYFNLETTINHLEMIANKHSLYNPAYLITQAVHDKSYGKKGKHIQIALAMKWLSDRIVQFTNEFKQLDTPQKQLDKLMTIPMVGPFLAGQILVDLGYCSISQFHNDQWVVLGPGSSLGLTFLELPIKNSSIEYLRDIQKEYLHPNWKEIASESKVYPWIPLTDVQNSLCEYSKWYKFNKGIGRKRYYKYTKGEINGN